MRLARPSTAELGLLGEELAARALRRAGWRLLGRRLATPFGEIDLVAAGAGQLVCVEVKAGLLHSPPGSPGSPPRSHLRWRPGLRLDAGRLARQRRAGRWLARRLPRHLGGGALTGGRVDLVEVLVVRQPPGWELCHHVDLARPLRGDRARWWGPPSPLQCRAVHPAVHRSRPATR